MFVGAAYDWPGVPNKLLTFRRHNRKDLNSKSTRDGGGSDMGDRLRRLAGGPPTVAGLPPGVVFAARGGANSRSGAGAPPPPTPRLKTPAPTRSGAGGIDPVLLRGFTP